MKMKKEPHSGNKICPVYVILQKTTFIKVFYENVGFQTRVKYIFILLTNTLTVIDLISFIDLICFFSAPQTPSFVTLVLEG